MRNNKHTKNSIIISENYLLIVLAISEDNMWYLVINAKEDYISGFSNAVYVADIVVSPVYSG